MKRHRTLEESLYLLGVIILFCIVTVLLSVHFIIIPNYKIILPKCIFLSILGIYCPGCGGTRSVFSMLRGDLLKSLWYHPLVLYASVIFAGFMLTHTLERIHFPHVKGMKFRPGYLYGAIAIIIVNFILKNILKFCFGIEMV